MLAEGLFSICCSATWTPPKGSSVLLLSPLIPSPKLGSNPCERTVQYRSIDPTPKARVIELTKLVLNTIEVPCAARAAIATLSLPNLKQRQALTVRT